MIIARLLSINLGMDLKIKEGAVSVVNSISAGAIGGHVGVVVVAGVSVVEVVVVIVVVEGGIVVVVVVVVVVGEMVVVVGVMVVVVVADSVTGDGLLMKELPIELVGCLVSGNRSED